MGHYPKGQGREGSSDHVCRSSSPARILVRVKAGGEQRGRAANTREHSSGRDDFVCQDRKKNVTFQGKKKKAFAMGGGEETTHEAGCCPFCHGCWPCHPPGQQTKAAQQSIPSTAAYALHHDVCWGNFKRRMWVCLPAGGRASIGALY